MEVLQHYEIIYVALAGLFAVFTPLYEPMLFMPADRIKYERVFHTLKIYIGPTAALFGIMFMFWLVVLPLFQVSSYNAVIIIGSLYIYLLLLYSIVDEKCTPALSGYLSLNFVLTLVFYRTYPTYEEQLNNTIILLMFIIVAYISQLIHHSFTQNLQWYLWYAGTMGGMLRW